MAIWIEARGTSALKRELRAWSQKVADFLDEIMRQNKESETMSD
jgi:hypothetical protein